MSEYSIYTITDEDRQFSESCTIVRCANDDEAIRRQRDGWIHMM